MYRSNTDKNLEPNRKARTRSVLMGATEESPVGSGSHRLLVTLGGDQT